MIFPFIVKSIRKFEQLFNTHDNYFSNYSLLTLKQRLNFLSLRVPKFYQPPISEYEIARIKFNKGVFRRLRIDGFFNGYLSIELHFNFPIPNLLWHYNKFLMWEELKYQQFQQWRDRSQQKLQIAFRIIRTIF